MNSRWWCLCWIEMLYFKIRSILDSVLPVSTTIQVLNPADLVWYENRPPGVHKLGKRWRLFLVERGFLKYTNHFVRASAITLPSDANVSGHQIMFVSSHSSKQSIAYYSSRPSASQLERVPDTISHALQREQPHSTQISSTPRFIHSSNRMVSSNVSMSAARASFLSDFFNSCNIQGDVQVYFSCITGLITKTDFILPYFFPHL